MLKTGNFRPVGEEDDAFRRHAFFDGFIHHRTRNRGDVIDVMQSATFERRCQLCHFAAFAFSGKAQPQHGVHFVILNMQHGTRAREFRQQAHSRRAKQRWYHANNAIRLPATLRHQRKETADGKTAEMQQAFQGARLFWHIQRAAPHRGGPLFSFVAPGGIVLTHLPLRVVRRCGNNPHLMTLRRQPFHHFSGVFADAG